MSTETEVKMGAWAGFELPALDGVVDDVVAVARAPRTLMATYHDTADLRLARWGVTVRHRTGEGDGWTVKLPEGADGPALVRRELSFEGPAGRMPAGAASLIRAYARDTPLEPVARIRTVRTGVNLLDSEGGVVAEVVDDEVSVLHGGRVATRFREVEVELGSRPPAGLLDAVVGRLREAGAGEPDPTPKVIRALGARALAPPEVASATLARKASAADLVRQAIGVAVERIMRHDPGVRIGDDPEDVHQARVGVRHLRADLRTFASVLDSGWRSSLGDELRWLAGLLGAVRDADVLIDRFRRQAAALPEPDTGALAPIFRRMAKDRDRARTELIEAMDSPRYVALLGRLVDAARRPRCRTAAGEPAADVVPAMAAAPWRTLRKAVRALPASAPDADLHRIRVLAKRARYAAESAAPLAGAKAASFAKALADVQGVLGDHHDAVVAEAWLRAAAEGADAAVSLAAGELIAVQRAEAAESRRRWPKAWKKASAKRLRAWM
ncbi:MAG: CHAD domain-containing protein [Acidimicrobiales bacterium]